jgi:hypothetical protein
MRNPFSTTSRGKIQPRQMMLALASVGLACSARSGSSRQVEPTPWITGPEMTTATVRVAGLPGGQTPGGVVWFVPQRRLGEVVPGREGLLSIAKMSEGSAQVAPDGLASLVLPPGNFLMVWDPNARLDDQGQIRSRAAAVDEPLLGRLGVPGPESLLARSREETLELAPRQGRRPLDFRVPRVEGNRLVGLDGSEELLPVYVQFNRFVRPPSVDLGTFDVRERPRVITVRLEGGPGGNSAGFGLRLRGHNGDLLDPVSSQLARLGQVPSGGRVFHFPDPLVQAYQGLLLQAPPAAPAGTAPGTRASDLGLGQGMQPTSRSTTFQLRNPDLVFDGEDLEVVISVEIAPTQ